MINTVKTLIRNCDIVDLETLQQKRMDILISDGMIEAMENKIEPKSEYTIIESRGMLALPAFVDAHTHMFQIFLKGPLDDMPITNWLVKLFSIEDIMTDEDYYYSTLLGCLESLRFGTTTICDMTGYKNIDISIQAMHDSGIRATVGVYSNDIAENEKTVTTTVEENLRQTEDSYQRFNGLDGGMVRICPAPAGLPAGSEILFKELKKFSDEKGTIFQCHLAEGKKETLDVMKRTGFGGEGEALYRYGILGPKTVLAHSIWLQDYELDLIKETGANPVHCPNTNMKISDGIPKIHQMLKKGINAATAVMVMHSTFSIIPTEEYLCEKLGDGMNCSSTFLYPPQYSSKYD